MFMMRSFSLDSDHLSTQLDYLVNGETVECVDVVHQCQQQNLALGRIRLLAGHVW